MEMLDILLSSESDVPESASTTLQELLSRIEKLSAYADQLRESIRLIRSSFPFPLAENLEDLEPIPTLNRLSLHIEREILAS